MQEIEKKCWNPDFEEIRSRKKNFDVRLDDRIYEKGDKIIFKEYNPKTNSYSGRICTRFVKIVKHLNIKSAVKFGITEIEYWTKEEISDHGLVILGF